MAAEAVESTRPPPEFGPTPVEPGILITFEFVELVEVGFILLKLFPYLPMHTLFSFLDYILGQEPNWSVLLHFCADLCANWFQISCQNEKGLVEFAGLNLPN